MAWTFSLNTFGCKVNQYESQALREAWEALGGLECAHAPDADWIVLNTCAVTSGAVSEARQACRRLHRLAPSASIIITGCSATAAQEELAALPGVVAVVPQKEKERLLGGPELLAQKTPVAHSPEAFPSFHINTFLRARPVIKVQDGCTRRCTYCIVPLLRGPSRSRTPEAVIDEARRLLAAGYREIMLSGINLHQYSIPGVANTDFWDLVSRLDAALADEWHGTARLRLSSLDPAQLTPKALETLVRTKLVCPHIHLSLQSGSEAVLRRMGRGHYSPRAILAFIRSLTNLWPLFGLGADILMGFPEEETHHAQETLDFINALPLSYAHVFPFSPRPGTVAATLKDLPGPVKQERAQMARERVDKKQYAFLERLLQVPEQLVACDLAGHDDTGEETDHEHGSLLKGVNEYYATCCASAEAPSPKNVYDFVRVRPLRIEKKRLIVAPV